MKEKIYKKLILALQPQFLEVKNNSILHRGHVGDDGSMETHFAVTIKDDELSKMGRLQAHQKINKILQEEFLQGIHALEIKILNKLS